VSEAELPAWPTPKYATQSDAIAAAIAASEPGEEIVLHAAECAMARDEDCSCWPQVITVPEGTV
jgi:hypothetical protein